MAYIYPQAYLKDHIVPIESATLSVASSAVLYGLSVYTVFQIQVGDDGSVRAFRLSDHYRRLINSARIIGIDTFEPDWPAERFTEAVQQLVAANELTENAFVRATIHVDELVPGTRSRGMSTALSMFIYEAQSILPQGGARLKTSVWRRIPDYSIPSRAKVNGAYINSVLGKQDALDSGYDDCIFLDAAGHVCELSAANIFLVRNNVLITPDATSDLLEGINRQTILQLAKDMDLQVVERTVDLTELYIADELFACGTSAYIAPVLEVDARRIGNGQIGPITQNLKEKYSSILQGHDADYKDLLTVVSS
ncbi:MAG TPA: aminotransferase class IV [Candidatus Saccharimonadales bacterium]|jgi:branched-chain amino acid aminotransferase